jgi:hypothetical protein
VDLVAEPHNTLDFWIFEIADANRRRCALLDIFQNSSNISIVSKSCISVIKM